MADLSQQELLMVDDFARLTIQTAERLVRARSGTFPSVTFMADREAVVRISPQDLIKEVRGLMVIDRATSAEPRLPQAGEINDGFGHPSPGFLLGATVQLTAKRLRERGLITEEQLFQFVPEVITSIAGFYDSEVQRLGYQERK